MKIRIDEAYEVTREHEHIETTIELGELSGYPNIVKISPVHVVIDVMNPKSGNYRVTGEINTEVSLTCSKCLDQITVAMNPKLNELFVQNEQVISEFEEDSKDDYNYIVGQEIDLIPFITQEILLSLPMKPVCKSNCQGLCPVCGINKNEFTCSCKTERIDPRLAGLADLLKNQSSD
ncbi:hypothetical protein BHU72_03040 [Desulfuribacillus stibiiarsenatis]|uniref:Metal-binding protein n=1 Tax=Desulfuribacillus stibiiarsenatis TaxID=1390249 RepID=A0A1E5L6I4_9FIRM|nr:DUF177 domain-containing protein [Desulfuribacillus stibiiarsenatis]OEH85772.1 hypothetical protein BHU72_03040 [Desulfuribacillus stibiiarsenatis]